MTHHHLSALLAFALTILRLSSSAPIDTGPLDSSPDIFPARDSPIDIALAEQGFILSDQYPKGIGPVRLSVDNLYNLLVSPNSSYGHDYYVGTGAAFLSMDNPANGFTLADNSKAPGGGCQYSRHQVRVGGFGQRHGEGTTIALGRRRRKEESDEVVGIPLDTPFTNATAATISHLNQNDNAPFACGELFWKRERATYGRYSADIRTPVGKAIGHVTGFYLRSRNGETELDIELTGLRKDRVWLNVWTADKQHPVNVTVPFSTSDNWHNYAIEWRAMWVAFYIDDRLMLNRTDLQTVPPDQANYRVAFNAWPQMVFDPTWAGNFKWPEDGHGPETHFRNFRYVP